MSKLLVYICQLALFPLLQQLCQVNAISCYSCDSADDELCLGEVKNLEKVDSSIELIQCEGQCFSAILSDRTTYRGCSENLPLNLWKFENCNTDKCNGLVFPSDRLSCYKCEGIDCLTVESNFKDDSQLCENYVDDDSCYTSAPNETATRRGCTSDPDYKASYFDETCSTSYCNSNSLIKTLSCLQCDTEAGDGLSCILGGKGSQQLGKCDMQFFVKNPAFCYMMHSADRVRRSCSGDEVIFDSSADGEVVKCTEPLCNDEPATVWQCFVCDSKNDLDCAKLDRMETNLANCSLGTLSCFECKDFDGAVRRGCGSPPSDCSDGSCFTCWHSPLCNSATMYECYSCSSLTDWNCDLFSKADEMNTEICNTGCQVSLQGDNVIRGCLDESLDCSSSASTNCFHCQDDNCNDILLDSHCGTIQNDNTHEQKKNHNEL